MKISSEGLNLIKQFEGFSATPYLCPAGLKTVGYGHLVQSGERFTKITPEQGEELLLNDVSEFEAIVDSLVHVEVNANQFSALVSLTFNLGNAPLRKTLGRKLNAGDYLGAAMEFDRWVCVNGKVSAGLARRRAAERALFLKPVLVS